MKPLWLAYLVVVCPRVLGASSYGTFNAALATASIGLVFADLGMTSYTLREVARAPGHAGRYVSNLLPLRLGLLGVGLAAGLGWAVAGGEAAALWALVFAIAFRVAESVAVYARVFMLSAEDHGAYARSLVLERGLTLAGGLGALALASTAASALAGMAAGAVLFAGGLLVVVARRYARPSGRLVSPSFLRRTVVAMAPLGLAEILTVLYLRVDQVMIEAVLGPTEAGVYGLSYRLLETLVIIPAIVVQNVLYPRMAKLAEARSASELGRLLWWGGLGLLGLSAVVTGGLWWGSDVLVGLAVPDAAFASSGAYLRVLALTFPLTCLSNLLFFLYVSTRRQGITLVALAAAAALNVGLNAALLPRVGVEGAIWATILSEAVIVVVYLARLPVALRGLQAAAGRPDSTRS